MVVSSMQEGFSASLYCTMLVQAYYSHLWMGLFLITPRDQTLHNSSSIFHLRTVWATATAATV